MDFARVPWIVAVYWKTRRCATTEAMLACSRVVGQDLAAVVDKCGRSWPHDREMSDLGAQAGVEGAMMTVLCCRCKRKMLEKSVGVNGLMLGAWDFGVGG